MLSNPQLINFLKKENTALQQQVKELKELLTINRQATRVSIEFKNGDTTVLPNLVKLLYEENSKLIAKVNSMREELENGLCKALVSQQIAFASTEHEKYMTNELKSKLVRLKKELEIRDNKLIQMQKSKGEFDQNNTQIRIIEITEPNIQNMKLKNDLEYLHEQLQIQKQQIEKYKDQKEDLMKLNLILTRQITEIKTISIDTTKSKNQDKSIVSPDITRFLNYQKRLLEDDNQQEIDSDGASQSELDENQSSIEDDLEEEQHQKTIQPKKQLSKLQLNLTSFNEGSKISKIPKLELTKAKEIQQLIVRKINNDQRKKQGTTIKQQKYRKLQTELTNIRKRLGGVLMQKLNQEKENACLRRIVKELQERNLLLAENRMMNEADRQYNKRYQQGEQTLIDMCRDVTLNQRLRDVVEGREDLPRKTDCVCFEV